MKPENKAYRIVRKNGFKTGSRVWGVHDKDSDYDFIVNEITYRRLYNIPDLVITSHETKESLNDYGSNCNPTFYFKYKEKTINIICPVESHYGSWIWATKCISALDSKITIVNKNTRVQVFGQLRELYMDSIAYKGTGGDIPF